MLPSLLAAALVGCSGPVVPGPSASIARPNFDEPVAGAIPMTLEGQLAQGERIYADQCAGCHGSDGQGGAAPQLIGGMGVSTRPRSFMLRRAHVDDAQELVEWLKGHEPADHPGTLSDADYYNVTAYLLAANEVPLAHGPLTPRTAASVALLPKTLPRPRPG